MPETISDGEEMVSIATPKEIDKMLEKTDEKTRKYLKKILETTTLNPISSSEYVANREPLVENVAYKDEGTVEAKKGTISLNFSYKMLDSNSPQRMLSSAFDADRNNPNSSFSDWRIVSNYNIIDSVTGKKLELMEVMPPEAKMIFRISLPQFYSFVPEDNICRFAENPTKPEVILVLLHEIGHVWALKKLDFRTHEKYLKSLSALNEGILIPNEAWVQILEQERDAWAFALKNIRSFLGNDSKKGWLTFEEVNKVIHEQALQTYSNVFRN